MVILKIKDYLYYMRLNIDKHFKAALENFDSAQSLIK